jgi:hypothetical protein
MSAHESLRIELHVYMNLTSPPCTSPSHLISPRFPRFLLDSLAFYRYDRSSSHRPSCAETCAVLCPLLQYVAALHWPHVTRAYARSSHPGKLQTRVSSTQKLSCSGMCSTACALLQYNATLHPAHLCRTAPSFALAPHAGYSHCLTSL